MRGGLVQVKNPGIDLPIGIVGSLIVCAFLYALMCVVICLMVPYTQIDINAPFSEVRCFTELSHCTFVRRLSPSVKQRCNVDLALKFFPLWQGRCVT